MQREFIITRLGRDYVMYAGLLDAAHRDGLASIRTRLVQAPSPANGFVAICHAEVTTAKGTFEAHGDADPDNTPRAMATTLVRLAETRAKARALADAVNVAMTAIEDLADAPSEASPVNTASRAPAPRVVPLPDTTARPHVDLGRVELRPPVPTDAAFGLTHEAPSDAQPRIAPPSIRSIEDVDQPPAPRAVRPRTATAPAETPARPLTSQGVPIPPPRTATAPAETTAPRTAARPVAGAPTTGLPATAKQLDVIVRLARGLGRTVSTEGLTRVTASDLITQLSSARLPSPRRDSDDDAD